VVAASKDATQFPQWTPELRADLLTETRMFVDDVLWKRGGRLAELVQSRRTFVDRPLARLYGLPLAGIPSGQFAEATFPEGQRSGLLTAGSLMAAHAHERDTSIVRRGLMVRNDVLCLDPLPPPPPGLLGSPEVKDALARLPDERARSVYRTTTGICAGCHGGIDTLGVLFEHYDAAGRYRGSYAGGPTIDASSTLDVSPALDGRVEDAVDLGRKIGESADLQACAARKILGLALGRTVTQSNSCEAAEVQRRFAAAGGVLPELFRIVATAPALRTRKGAP
jgi:hypothetical protein